MKNKDQHQNRRQNQPRDPKARRPRPHRRGGALCAAYETTLASDLAPRASVALAVAPCASVALATAAAPRIAVAPLGIASGRGDVVSLASDGGRHSLCAPLLTSQSA